MILKLSHSTQKNWTTVQNPSKLVRLYDRIRSLCLDCALYSYIQVDRNLIVSIYYGIVVPASPTDGDTPIITVKRITNVKWTLNRTIEVTLSLRIHTRYQDGNWTVVPEQYHPAQQNIFFVWVIFVFNQPIRSLIMVCFMLWGVTEWPYFFLLK